ncbi:protein Peter pan-like [Procambarus clarkii]|uniref:protein Peter pan-like n=1 Tax=Procambarus clarkii TaxID=6728 RepID=UPI00374300CD
MPRHKAGKLSRRNRVQARAKQTQETKRTQCFVINRGNVGKVTKKLTQDFRRVMEPNTATKLKQTKNNAIKDFIAISAQLNVTHLVVFSQTSVGLYLKLCRLAHGPTLTFKIINFARSKDVLSSLKKQNVFSGQYLVGPCLMTNLQPQEGDLHLQLSARMFLDMFPTITPNQVKTESIRRCCLIHYDFEEGLFDFRHYSIKVVPIGISKAVKKMNKRKLPDLSNFSDVSEFMTKSGLLSESEAEDDPSAHVTVDVKVAPKKLGRQQSSVRLSELGPRLSLKLLKIEEGLLEGKTLYNSTIVKTPEEILELEKKKKRNKQLKLKRKQDQEMHVEAKKKKKEEHKKICLDGMGINKKEKDNVEKVGDDAGWEDVPDDDAQYYRDEVGEEPDADLFSKQRATKRKMGGGGPFKKKFKSSTKTEKLKASVDSDGLRKNKSKDVKKIGMKTKLDKEKLKGRKKPHGKKLGKNKHKKNR